MLPSGLVNGVGTLESLISRLNSPACTYPFQRFASALTDVDAWFGATVDRYSFDVGLFHSFLHAGLSRRSNCSSLKDRSLSRGCRRLPWQFLVRR
jgi:hypothetical protein